MVELADGTRLEPRNPIAEEAVKHAEPLLGQRPFVVQVCLRKIRKKSELFNGCVGDDDAQCYFMQIFIAIIGKRCSDIDVDVRRRQGTATIAPHHHHSAPLFRENHLSFVCSIMY